MGRKKSVTQVAAAAAAAAVDALENPDRVGALEDDEATPGIVSALEALAGLEPEAEIKYCVYSESSTDLGYLDIVQRVDLTAEYFAERWGPGTYRVVAKSGRGFVRGGQKTFRIARRGREAIASAHNGATAQAQPATDAATKAIELEERRAKMRRDEMREWVALLATPVATLGAAILSRPAPAPLDLAAVITALQPRSNTTLEVIEAAKAMRGSDNSAPMHDFVLKMLDKMEKFPQPEGGGGSWFGDLLHEGLPVVREMMAAAAQARAGGAPGSVLPPRPTPLPAAPPPASSPAGVLSGASPSPSAATTPEARQAEMQAMVQAWLRAKATLVLEWAQVPMRPDTAADALIEMIPAAWRPPDDTLLEWLNNGEWWLYVASFEPRLTPYQGWCDQVRRAAIDILEQAKFDAEQGGDDED